MPPHGSACYHGAVFIRSREEALAALAEILELPERRNQIVQATVKVASCLDPSARALLADAQAAIIEDGLDALRRRRREALARLPDSWVRRCAPAVDLREDPLLEEVGRALDLLKMVALLAEVFPTAVQRYPRWEIARFIHENENWSREAIAAGLRRRGKPAHAALEEKVLARIEEHRPWWAEWAGALREACRHHAPTAPVPSLSPEDPDLLFHVIAMSEGRARTFLTLLSGTSAGVESYLSEIRRRIDLVLTAQQGTVP